ncbi:MAG: LysR family transcriptional regulator [Betaproteobacteria bacterium]|nr:LysR family transcriptional regulator [Betaproteobacteria bacterium]
MDTKSLEMFAVVVRQGSFAAAARDQNVDPSSVSRVIAALEAELDVRLFQRTTRQLTLTEAGSLYFERIEPLLEEIRHARDAAAEASSQVKGTLRVTASNSFGLKRILPLIPAFAAQYPDLTVDLMLTDTVVDLLAERIDIAIRLGMLTDSNMVAQLLMQTRYRVVASPAYLGKYGAPKKPEHVGHHNCLLFPIAGYRSLWIFRNRKGVLSEVPVHGKLLVTNALGLQQCALAGMGLTLLPVWLVEEDILAGKLVDVFPQWEVSATNFNSAAWLVYPTRSYVPLKVRVFIDFLKARLNG